MIAVVSLLLVLTISMLVIRVASVALVHTGMGREVARFQARSAFTGAGFTTGESETVVDHPVRRRIVGARDYARLLHLREDYGVSHLRVQPGDWVAGRTLGEAGVSKEGILVLGIECPGGHFIGAPAQDTEIREHDLVS